MENRLHMIGGSHLDQYGPRKLASAFELIKPNTILVEGSQSKYDAQQYYLKTLRELIEHRGVNSEVASLLLGEQELKK